jgi:hypothetical protein
LRIPVNIAPKLGVRAVLGEILLENCFIEVRNIDIGVAPCLCKRKALKKGENMKKIILVLLATVVLSLPIISHAASIDSMGGLKWGATIEEFSRLKDPSPIPFDMQADSIERKFTSQGTGDYVRFGRRYYMIGDTSQSGGYYFYKNKFYQFSVDTGSGYGETFRQTLITKYGKPKEIRPLVLYTNPNAKVGNDYTWILGDVTIFLRINNMKNESSLLYTYDPISKLKILEDKKKTKGMEKDL